MKNLINVIKQRNAILFVGAGVSATLGVPTWSELIDHIGHELGYDSDVFRLQSESYLQLAEFYKIRKGTIGPLRSWMDKEFNVGKGTLSQSKAHEYITQLGFHAIYTTNYDSNIEAAFDLHNREYNKIVSVKDFGSAHHDRTDIIKFHGDFDDDKSIVLTETDYFNRLSFESPLDIRFRSDVIGRPTLFIGYSLSDINLRLLLYKISKLWRDSDYGPLQPKSYILLSHANDVVSSILEQWGIETIVRNKGNQTDNLTEFLLELRNGVG